MALFEDPWANLAAGFASLKNPNLIPGILQQQNLQTQQNRQAEEDRRRRLMEDWKFKQLQNQAQAQQNVSEGLLGLQQGQFGPPTQAGLLASDLYAAGQPKAALSMAFPEPTKPTTLMQNIEAAGFTRGTPAYQAKLLEAILKPQTQINMGTQYGAVPSGAVREKGPSGESVIRYLPGSPEYEKRLVGYQGLENAADRLVQMQQLINKYGTEIIPGEAKGTMANLYGAILSDVAKARDLGVIQPGELQFIQMQIANPSDPFSLFVGKEGMTAQYKRQLNEVQSIMKKAFYRLKNQGISLEEKLEATGEVAPTGRPIFKNQFGDYVTERTITVTDSRINNGKPTNIPTVFNGQFLNQEQAIDIIARSGGIDPVNGEKLKPFKTINDAVMAARARSKQLGNQINNIFNKTPPLPGKPIRQIR